MMDVDLKRGAVFSFLDGSISIKLEGYGERNGWAELVFDEKQVNFVPLDDREGSSLLIEMPKSELIELRDFLNRTFPAGERS